MNIIKKILNKSIKCYKDVLYLKILRKIYQFDDWHTLSSYNCRKYKKQLVEIINNIKNENLLTIEIGCGLGDIISRVESKSKIGFDLDKGVVNASKKLYKNTDFYHGSFNEVASLNKSIDLLILVNWIHGIPMHELEKDIQLINKNNNIEYILVDEILPTTSGYKYHHDFTGLANYQTASIIDDIEKVRRYRVLKNMNYKVNL